MSTDTASALFPIRELVERTGVNASTLRAWENRHGLIVPVRTASGHRLYGQADVARIRRVQELLAQGLALGRIAARLAAETPETLAANDSEGRIGWPGYIAETLRALADFSTERLDHVYGEACALFPIDAVTEGLLIPVLGQLGERWDKRPSGIAEEHFYSAWLRNKLGARLHHASAGLRGKTLILACLPGEGHEIGLLIFALMALQAGYRVIYLGANMPTRQIVHVARQVQSAAIVLAGRPVADAAAVLADVGWLAAEAGARVFVGSHVSVQLAQELRALGVVPLGDDMTDALRLLGAGLAAPVGGAEK
ncbi:MAG: MerR family transcriptional regulator [Thiobacillus sp.]|nr:MerR family transcriptional regulator [Thiobacillus sp.]